MKVVEVVFDIPVDRSFDYLPGKFSDKICKGVRVCVPFGRQRQIGIVTGIKEVDREERSDYKNILKLYDNLPLIGEEHFELSSFIAKRYFSSIGQALFAMIGALPLKYPIVTVPSKVRNINSSPGYSKEYLRFLSYRKKVQVYREIISSYRDGSVLFLFPETSIAEEYYRDFSSLREGRVVLFHSELKGKEKINTWLRILTEGHLVIVGTRIAVFSPVPDLKAIVVDRGSDPSYKEQQTPRYNAFEVAEFRCLYNNIPLIVGEPALSLNEYIDVQEGKAVQKVYNGENLPSVHTFFMSKKNIDKNLSFFVSDTLSLFEETLLRGNKVAIVHNRKGSSKILFCERCEHRIVCDICNSAMVLSDDGKNLLCRFCKTIIPFERKCPSCGSKKIGERIYGIEKIFRTIKEFYPDWKTIKFTGSTPDILEPFDIAIGTSAIKKIMRQNRFSLVVIISGESFLNIPDYNSEEKFFIMVNEMRSMIENTDCKIIIQTRSPNLEVYKALVENNPEIFYKKELSVRKQLLYPPFSEMIKIEIEGVRKDVFERKKKMVEDYIVKKGYELFFSGPSFPPVKKGRGIWKYLLRFKGEFDREEMKRELSEIITAIERNPDQI